MTFDCSTQFYLLVAHFCVNRVFFVKFECACVFVGLWVCKVWAANWRCYGCTLHVNIVFLDNFETTHGVVARKYLQPIQGSGVSPAGVRGIPRRDHRCCRLRMGQPMAVHPQPTAYRMGQCWLLPWHMSPVCCMALLGAQRRFCQHI